MQAGWIMRDLILLYLMYNIDHMFTGVVIIVKEFGGKTHLRTQE